jgi:hypothetical protein
LGSLLFHYGQEEPFDYADGEDNDHLEEKQEEKTERQETTNQVF